MLVSVVTCSMTANLCIYAVVTDETLKAVSAAQYVEGFDACTREVTDCLQSQNMAISPEIYAGLLSHLATRRRRLLLARSRGDQHATELPPGECLRLCLHEDPGHVQTAQLARQVRAVTGQEKRSPLLSIANVQPMAVTATETKPNLNNERTSQQSVERKSTCTFSINVSAALQADRDVSHNQHTEGCTSRDVMDETDHDDVLSLATDDDVTSLMWRPW